MRRLQRVIRYYAVTSRNPMESARPDPYQDTKMAVEGALEGERDNHLGYPKHHPAGRDGGNSRNGHRPRR